MYLLNFGHPFTEQQLASLSEHLGGTELEEVKLAAHFDPEQTFQPQVDAVMRRIEIKPDEWQQQPIIVNLPTLSVIAGLVLAELHGRMGYFPPVVRLKPVSSLGPVVFELAEVLNLNAIRDQARRRR